MSTVLTRGLDDLTWDKLLDEARRMIPAHAPEWTDHNPSDPGITIVELFAYFSEMLGYRIDRLSRQERNALLALLNGPAWKPGTRFDDDLRMTILESRAEYRAVSAADFERLALLANNVLRNVDDRVARARCIPQRDTSAPAVLDQPVRRPGHMSVVIVPKSGGEAPAELTRAVRNVLEPARLLTTRLHVTSVRYVPIRVRATLVAKPGETVNPSDAVKALQQFLHPVSGWSDSSGWPFGREVHVSEINKVLDEVAGVDYVIETIESRQHRRVEMLWAEPANSARLVRDASGNIEAILIDEDELPMVRVEPRDFNVLSSREGELRMGF